jgi:hypothetical protein
LGVFRVLVEGEIPVGREAVRGETGERLRGFGGRWWK